MTQSVKDPEDSVLNNTDSSLHAKELLTDCLTTVQEFNQKLTLSF